MYSRQSLSFCRLFLFEMLQWSVDWNTFNSLGYVYHEAAVTLPPSSGEYLHDGIGRGPGFISSSALLRLKRLLLCPASIFVLCVSAVGLHGGRPVQKVGGQTTEAERHFFPSAYI